MITRPSSPLSPTPASSSNPTSQQTIGQCIRSIQNNQHVRRSLHVLLTKLQQSPPPLTESNIKDIVFTLQNHLINFSNLRLANCGHFIDDSHYENQRLAFNIINELIKTPNYFDFVVSNEEFFVYLMRNQDHPIVTQKQQHRRSLNDWLLIRLLCHLATTKTLNERSIGTLFKTCKSVLDSAKRDSQTPKILRSIFMQNGAIIRQAHEYLDEPIGRFIPPIFERTNTPYKLYQPIPLGRFTIIQADVSDRKTNSNLEFDTQPQ